VNNCAPDLQGKRALLFSYGSGLAATLFSVKFEKCVKDIAAKADVSSRLESRTEVSPEEFTRLLEVREKVSALQCSAQQTPASMSSIPSH
jgi:hydroxymethylglutaryl-CoA synthase